MKRNFDLKRRESKNLPLEKLQEVLSEIYPEETVKDLMRNFAKSKKKGGEGK